MKSWQRSLGVIAALCVLIAFHPDRVMAQARTTTGGAGSSGFGSLGGSSGGLSGSNSFGGGQNRFSTTNANSAGANQSVLGNQQSNFGFQGGQQNGMVGARNTQNFLGANQRNTQQGLQGQQNQFGNRNRNRNQNQFDQNDQNMNPQGQDDSRRSIRPQQKVAFDIPERSETEIKDVLSTRFERVTRQPALRGVTVDLDADGVVVLRGEVLTPSQKQLAANMVRLEPGVRKVRNELTVGTK